MSEQDSITLPYNAVIGFEFLINSLPPQLAAGFTMALFGITAEAEASVTQVLNYLSFGTASLNLTDSDRTRLNNKISATQSALTALAGGLNAFFASSNAGLVIMKLLLCNSPFGISPFWVTQPSRACNHS